MDSIFVELHHQHLKNDRAAILNSVREIDSLVIPLEKVYPWLSGLVQLNQAYYMGNAAEGKPYLERALKNLEGANSDFFLNNSGSFLWLIEGFYLEKRHKEWEAADSIFRRVLNSDSGFSSKLAVSRTAGIALLNKEYKLVETLAKYDELYFGQFNTSEDKFYLVYVKWLQLKQSLDQWVEVINSEREDVKYRQDGGMLMPEVKDPDSRDMGFKNELKMLLGDIEQLQPELSIKTDPSSQQYDEYLRKDYLKLQRNISRDLYLWAITVHRQSEAILPLKKFLFYQLPVELKKIKSSEKEPVLTSGEIAQLIKNLADLYYHLGNPEQANNVIVEGLQLIESSYSGEKLAKAISTLLPLQARIKRLAGEPETALRKIALLKKYTPKPRVLTTESFFEFEAYAEARVEEIYTLLALGEQKKSRDSLSFLMDQLETMTLENEALLYETSAWTHLLYLAGSISAQKGRYDVDLTYQLVADMLRGEVTSEIFYPAQLFALKAKWHEKGELDMDYLQNLLSYTERQLKYNFIFLSPEERMRLYNYRLNDIFDLYHQLLFEHHLELYPKVKQQVLSQTLYLKNALTDGNLISDELLKKGDIVLDKENLDMLRNLKQTTKLSQEVDRFYSLEAENFFDQRDLIQTTWLDLLEEGMKELVQPGGLEKIRENIKPGETYIETVRYTRSLSDSTAVYGAYVINANKFELLNICTEPELLKLLKQKNSSPQTFSLTGSTERGGIGISLKKNEGERTFQTGDRDLLAKVLLEPLWPHIKNQSELLMVHDGLLNRISFAALLWEEKFLMEHFRIRHFSGSAAIGLESPSPLADSRMLLAGGLDYGQKTDYTPRLLKEGIDWEYLPGTMSEIGMLQTLFLNAGYKPEIRTGKEMTDVLSRELGQFSIVHMATHGFYFDSPTADRLFHSYLNRQAMHPEPFFRSGLAISNANNPPTPTIPGTEGYLMGYELASLDLRNCYLITLSACETGLGDLRNNLGVDGLPRALKIAGAKNLLISLWKVPDAPTAEFMKLFYSELFNGKSLAGALQETQQKMSLHYPASDWGAFILVE